MKKIRRKLNDAPLGASFQVNGIEVKKMRLSDGYVYFIINGDVFELSRAAELLESYSE